jgi:uncharacterized membrane protein YccC
VTLWHQLAVPCPARVCALQEAAAEQQREFERARAVMEAQLRQLSAHMSSKEALIAALQRSEAEARLLSQQYQVRGGGQERGCSSPGVCAHGRKVAGQCVRMHCSL